MFGFKSLATVGRRDTPLTDDSVDALEIAPYARGLEHFICTCETPMTVGIQGEWGSGNTSMMRLIEKRLTPAAREAT
jgi:predicted KAP-like P-loop ATPase